MLWSMTTNSPENAPQPAQPSFAKVAECLYRNESSGIYYALVKRHSKQFRRSLKTADCQLARRRLAEFRDKVTRLSQTQRATSLTFDELATRWFDLAKGKMKESSALRRQTCIHMLKPFFKNKAARNLTARDLDEWEQKRRGATAAQTFNIERETLIHILDLAVRDGILLENPARQIKRQKRKAPKAAIPTREQFRLLVQTIRAADPRAQAGGDLVELLAYSGMRLGEAVALRWRDVDFKRGVFTVTGGERGTKNSEQRTVPLFPSLRPLLERIRGERAPAVHECVIPISTAKKCIETACRKAGLPDFHHHSLRHCFCSNAIEAGADFKVIAGWLGHKDGGVLVAKTYGHLRDVHSMNMAKLMTFSATAEEPTNVVSLPTAATA